MCGCKNKGAQPPQQPQTQTTQGGAQPAPQSKDNTIQESIRKVVEKYYKK
jgi:hypothetical protein